MFHNASASAPDVLEGMKGIGLVGEVGRRFGTLAWAHRMDYPREAYLTVLRSFIENWHSVYPSPKKVSLAEAFGVFIFAMAAEAEFGKNISSWLTKLKIKTCEDYGRIFGRMVDLLWPLSPLFDYSIFSKLDRELSNRKLTLINLFTPAHFKSKTVEDWHTLTDIEIFYFEFSFEIDKKNTPSPLQFARWIGALGNRLS